MAAVRTAPRLRSRPLSDGELLRAYHERGELAARQELIERQFGFVRLIDELTVKLGRSPNVDELSRHTGATVEQVLEALESSAAYSTLSLSERPDSDDDGQGPVDTLGEEDEAFERSEDRLTLATGIRHLHARERMILHLRFFEALTQSDIAERVGISQMHVSRLIRDSLARLREEL